MDHGLDFMQNLNPLLMRRNFRYKDGNFNLHLFKPWYNNYKVESFFRLKLKISLTTEPIESSFLGSRRFCDGLRLFYFLINFLKYF